MAELGIHSSEVQAEINNINSLANKVDDDAKELVAVAKKISAKGIQGVDWYDGTFSNMLNKLENNKVSDAVAEIKFQAQKLVGISETSTAFSTNQE